MHTVLQTHVSTTLRELTTLKDVHEAAVFMGPLWAFKALELACTDIRCLSPQLSYDPLDNEIDTFSLMFPKSSRVIYVREATLGFYLDCCDLIFLATRAKMARHPPTPLLMRLNRRHRVCRCRLLFGKVSREQTIEICAREEPPSRITTLRFGSQQQHAMYLIHTLLQAPHPKY